MKRARPVRRAATEPEWPIMLKALLVAVLVAATLAGCVVYPAHPVYYRGPVVVY